jgi:hypothetical protein
MPSIREYIKRLVNPPVPADEYWFSVRCARCGEELRVRVDLRNELSLQDGDPERPRRLYCRKVIIGQRRCYQPIEAQLYFSLDYTLVEHSISGGEFVQD